MAIGFAADHATGLFRAGGVVGLWVPWFGRRPTTLVPDGKDHGWACGPAHGTQFPGSETRADQESLPVLEGQWIMATPWGQVGLLTDAARRGTGSPAIAVCGADVPAGSRWI